jgi:hypothetical protein
MHEALHQRTIRTEVITGETNFLYGTKTKNKFSYSIYAGWSCSFFYFHCDNGSPDGTDVQAGLTDRIIYQRYVGGFLVFPLCGYSVSSSCC